MERLLFGEEMDKINKLYKEAFNLENNIVYFPIRHHSPACSFHLQKVIAEYKPEIILIEGPSNANDLIESLVHEDSKTPLSIYYTYSDSKALLGEKDDKYMCYYPFLDYSPEYAALKVASENNILVKFIDLSYEQILINSKQNEGIREKFKKKNYNDDYFFDRSNFIKELCKKQNCRNFDELWEKLYEIDGIDISTQTFVKNLLAYCYFSRVELTDEMLIQDGCIAREIYMNRQIEKYSKVHRRVLVVTGGFHTYGLLKCRDENVKLKIKRVNKEDTRAYAMAYSFEECDSLNGYASGMPYTAFYNEVWQNICEKKEVPYENTVMYFIAKCGRELRKKGEGISTADAIEALNMAKGLASLRDKIQCGAYELIDGIRSSFIKGDISISNNAPIDYLDKLMTGDKIGKLSSIAKIPPIVLDFREKCNQLKVKIDTSVEQRKILNIYKMKSHREVSKLFHMMNFLETNFCIRTKGPDFTINRNTNIIRETWDYKWKPSVETKLIEHSVYGGSLKEAVREIIVKKMSDIDAHTGEAAKLMINVAVMGLEDLVGKILIQMEIIIQNDGEFYSLTEGCNKLHFLYKEKYLMGILNTEKIEILIKIAYEKSASLISGLYNISKEAENDIIQKLKELYNISMDSSLSLNDEIYSEQLKLLIDTKNCNTALEGAAVGILIGLNQVDTEEAVSRAKSYLYATGEKLFEAATYLKGIFSTSRDLILYSNELLKGIDHMLREVEYEDFMKIIPEMRLAFSFFIPSEIDEIGENVGVLYDKNIAEILDKKPINEEDIMIGKQLDKMAVEQLVGFGVLESTKK